MSMRVFRARWSAKAAGHRPSRWVDSVLRASFAVAALTLLVFIAVPAYAAPAITLRLIGMQQAGMTPEEMNAVVREFETQHPNVRIEATYVAYDALHDKLVTSISPARPAYDIILVDDIWFPKFAEAGWLLDVTDRIPPELAGDVFPAAWDIVTYNGRRWGLPWLLDQKYFFYNTEILEQAGISKPPSTWEEMVDQARLIKQKGLVEYPIIWSWAQIEALICDWVVLLHGNGGLFFDPHGDPMFNSSAAVDTLEWMVATIAEGITNPASLTASEEDVRNVFSQGNAAFALNWVYMYDLANDPNESKVAGKVGMAMVPVFERARKAGAVSATINGSMGFAVTARSPHPDEALAFVLYLTSRGVQRRYPAHVTPMWSSLYEDPDLFREQPVTLRMFQRQFPHSHVRPKVPYYTELSKVVQVAIHEALTGLKTPERALNDAFGRVKEIQARW